jgi:hypothetical protein
MDDMVADYSTLMVPEFWPAIEYQLEIWRKRIDVVGIIVIGDWVSKQKLFATSNLPFSPVNPKHRSFLQLHHSQLQTFTPYLKCVK